MNKPDKHSLFLEVAQAISKMSTCLKRNVGCVLLDKYNRIIGTGYNGSASGLDHCDTCGCARKDCKPGESLEKCRAIHAEANALMHCNDIKLVVTAYIFGASPCIECAKLLCNSGVRNVYVDRLYAPEHVDAIRPHFEQKGIQLHVKVEENVKCLYPFNDVIKRTSPDYGAILGGCCDDGA